ncbi:MAG TPA: ABC transporter substrate-binding protein [Alphaproteobacteria bacterium]|nr:ABC transporter substrate-binding protein [Alphaproteobacteria bacterium]
MNTHTLHTSTIVAGLVVGLLGGLVSTAYAAQSSGQTEKSTTSRYMRDYPKQLLKVQPPWNKPMYQGTELTVPGLQNVPDIHGDVNNPQLVVFFAGNQYMLVNRLMLAFSKAYPKYPRVVAFTMPPGRLITSIKRGNGILIGNMRITLKPDILTAGKGSIMGMQKKLNWFKKIEVYAKNRLAIMVYKDNPSNVTGLKDLAQTDIKLCMPNPEWEGIAKHAIIPALKKTGGAALVNALYKKKVSEGTTFLTHIHHRQTPVRIMERKCTAGVVWYTEAYFHDKIAHNPISIVTIPKQNNKIVGYTAGLMRNAPDPEAGLAFMAFLMSPESQKIYKQYGFMPPK